MLRSLALAFLLSTIITAAEQPNIVMLISDDQAWTDYGFMGHKTIKTPNLDRLAKESLTFTHGYVPASLCCPSLASMITGMYPHQHKITSNDPPIPAGMKPREFQTSPAFDQGRERMNQFMDAQSTLPRLLVKNGYLALQTGKWWQGSFERGGFTHGMTHGKRHGDAGLDIGRKTMQPIYDFIGTAQEQKKPFFVWYAPMMPHDPHTPPKALLDKYLAVEPNEHIAKYWAMVEWFDQTCGDLLKHLDEKGLTQNTIIVYVTDNGWIQDPSSERYAERSKQSQYDGGLRTPIMVRWPAKVQPKMSEQAISSIDIAPTLLAATGITKPESMTGINVLDETALNARHSIFGECCTHNAVNLDKPAASLRWRWTLRDGMKLIVPSGLNDSGTTVELYDLKNDPFEQKNLAAEKTSLVTELRASLDHWWKP